MGTVVGSCVATLVAMGACQRVIIFCCCLDAGEILLVSSVRRPNIVVSKLLDEGIALSLEKKLPLSILQHHLIGIYCPYVVYQTPG